MRCFLVLLIYALLACGCSTNVAAPSDANVDAPQDGGALQIVFNEAAGTGGDFVELLNQGATEFDISGYAIADSHDGAPRIAGAVRFPSGTVVPAGGYVVVMMESNCASDLARCFRGEYGISQSNGETVYLLDAQDRVARELAYPPDAAPAGRSWGRTPNGTGEFRQNARTLGSANVE